MEEEQWRSDTVALDAPPTIQTSTAQSASVKTSQRRIPWKWLIIVALFIISLIVGLIVLKSFLNRPKSTATNQTATKTQDINLGNLANIATPLQVANTDKVIINGQLEANKGLVLNPISEPSIAVMGQIYFDATTNSLRYYDGGTYQTLATTSALTAQTTGAISRSDVVNIVNNSISNASGLTLPQDLSTTASPQFAGLKLGNTTLGVSGASLNFTLPSTTGSANQCLITDGSGNLSFSSCVSGAGNAFVQGGNAFGATATLGTTDTNDLNLITNGSTRLTIKSGGNVGIANNTALNKLSVNTPFTNDANTVALISTGAAGTKGLVIQGWPTQAANMFEVQTSGALPIFSIGATGNVTALTTTNSASAFQVQNASSTVVLGVDTTNGRVGVNIAAPSYPLDVIGNVHIDGASALIIGGSTVCTSSGCGAQPGNPNYIQNGFTIQSNANFAIQSVARTAIGGQIRGNTLQTLVTDADLLQLQYANGTPVVTVGATGRVLVQPSVNSTTAFQIQNAAGNANLLIADTTNNLIGVGMVPVYKLDVNGDVNVGIAGAYRINGQVACQWDNSLPTPGPSCTGSGGSGFYIQNGTNIQANANFAIESGQTNLVGAKIRGINGQTADILQVEDNTNGDTNPLLRVAAGGAVTLQNAVDSTSAFIVKDTPAEGNNIFVVDTTNKRVGVNEFPSLFPLDVNGDVNLDNSGSYRINGTVICDLNGCSAGSGSGNYIQNNAQTVQTGANYYIQSASPAYVTGRLLATSGQTADVFEAQNSTGTVSMFSVGATGIATFQNTNNSTAALVVKDSGGTNTILQVDTTNQQVIANSTVTNAVLGTTSNSSSYGVVGRGSSGGAVGGGVQGLGYGSGIGIYGSAMQNASGFFQTGNTSGTNTTATLIAKQNTSQTANLFEAQSLGGTPVFSVGYNGNTTITPSTNSTTTLQVQNTLGNSLLTVDSTNSKVILGKASSADATVVLQQAANNNEVTLKADNGGGLIITPSANAAPGVTIGGSRGTLFVGDPNLVTNQVALKVQVGSGASADTLDLVDTSGTPFFTVGPTGNTQLNGTFLQSGSGTFGTGTGAVSLNGDTTVASGKTLTVTTLGSATNDTYLCYNGSSQVAACSTTANGAAFVQNGNSFGATAVLGTNDTNNLSIRTNSTTRATFDQSNNLYLGNGVTSATPSNFTIQGTGGSGSNVAGASLTIAGGVSTGTANGGGLNFQTSKAAAGSGSSANSLSTVFSLAGGTGAANFQNTTNSSTAFQIQNAAGTTLLSMDTTAQSGNLVTSPNSDFEGIGTGSNTSGWVTKGDSTLTVVGSGTTTAYSGSQSFQVSINADYSGGGSICQFSTGASCTGGASTTVTGTGTTFTSALVGATLFYGDNTFDTITGFTDATHITVATSRTHSSTSTFYISGYGARYTPSPTLSSNTSYTLSMFVKASGTAVSDLIAGYQTDGLDSNRISNGTSAGQCGVAKIILISTWSQIVCNFTTGTISSSATIYVKRGGTNSTSPSTEAFFIDDVELYNTSGSKISLGNAAGSVLGQLTFASNVSGGSVTLQAPPGLTSSLILGLPIESGTICTDNPSSRCSVTNDGTYLKKNTTDSASVSVGAGVFLYNFTNSNSAVSGGILSLNNNDNTGQALKIVGSGSSGSLILAQSTTTSGTITTTNQLNIATNGGVSLRGAPSAATGNGGTLTLAGGAANTTGSGGAVTLTGGAANAASGSQNGGAVTITGGAGAGTAGNGANVSIQGGAGAGTGTDGNVLLGSSTASAVTLGNSTANVTLTGSTSSSINLGCVGYTSSNGLWINDQPSNSDTLCTNTNNTIRFGGNTGTAANMAATIYVADAGGAGGRTGGDLTLRAGNGSASGGVGGNLILQSGSGGTVGQIIVKPNGSNRTDAFVVQNSSGTQVLGVDTTNSRLAIGNDTAPGFNLSFAVNAGVTTARTIGVEAQTTANIGGNGLSISAAVGNGTGNGGTLALLGGQAGNGASGANGGAILIVGGTGGVNSASAGNGGLVSISGGVPDATNTVNNHLNGGAATFKGGNAATDGGNGGAVTIQGGNSTNGGNQTSFGMAGGSVTVSGGTAAASCQDDCTGGSVTIQGGTAGNTTCGTNNFYPGTCTGGSISITAASVTGAFGFSSTAVAGSITIDAGVTSTGTNGTINIGTVNSVATTIGTTGGTVTINGNGGSTAITIQSAANGTTGIGNNAVTNTIQVGTTSTNTGHTQTINIGNLNAAGTTNVTVGTGTSATAGTTTIQAFGVLTLQGGANSILKSYDVSAASTNSGALAVRTGNSSTSGNTADLTIATGNATSGNSGNVTIGAGTATGTAGGVLVKNGTDSANAFRVQNAAGSTTYFGVDTTGNGTISLQTPASGTINIGTTNGSITVNIGKTDGTGSLVVNGNSTFKGHIISGNLNSHTTTVSAVTANCGTGCTASVSGYDTAGLITLTMGTGATTGTQVTLTYGDAYVSTAPQVVITPVDVDLAGGAVYPQYYIHSATATFDLKAYAAFSDSKVYYFSYHVIQ